MTEKALENYIRTEMLVQMPLHPCQYAYQVGKFTEYAFVQLKDDIQEAMKMEEIGVCAFRNKERAFVNTPHDAVIETLNGR